jgi:transposase
MAVIYSQDLRERVLRALERNERAVSIAERLEVSESWIYQVKRRFQQDGERCPKKVGGYRHSRIEHLEMQIRQWIVEKPDLTLAQISERLIQEYGILIKTTALWTQLNHWDLTYKKNAASKRTATRGCSD